MQRVKEGQTPDFMLGTHRWKKGLCDASFTKLRRILNQTRTLSPSPLVNGQQECDKIRLSPFSPYYCFQIPDNSFPECRVFLTASLKTVTRLDVQSKAVLLNLMYVF